MGRGLRTNGKDEFPSKYPTDSTCQFDYFDEHPVVRRCRQQAE
jgi:hypothetical protein